MRSVFVLLSALPLLLATAGASHAQYDLSGRWLVSGATTFLDETTPYTNRHWDVVQGAGTITVTRSNEDGVVIGTLCSEIAATPLAEVAGRTRPANAELLELARIMAI